MKWDAAETAYTVVVAPKKKVIPTASSASPRPHDSLEMYRILKSPTSALVIPIQLRTKDLFDESFRLSKRKGRGY